jgi:hypothetical protein
MSRKYHDDVDGREFLNETAANERLLHYRLHKKGIVPLCHGLFEFPADWIERYIERGDLDSTIRAALLSFQSDERLPQALVFDFVDSTHTLTPFNLTDALAEVILERLHQIHECQVRHEDIHPRNILLHEANGPVFVRYIYIFTFIILLY